MQTATRTSFFDRMLRVLAPRRRAGGAAEPRTVAARSRRTRLTTVSHQLNVHHLILFDKQQKDERYRAGLSRELAPHMDLCKLYRT